MNRVNRIITLLIVFSLVILAAGWISGNQTEQKILNPHPWGQTPITVHIDDKNVPEHYSPSYRKDVERALEYWEMGGNGKLAYQAYFEMVDSDNADIVIMWVDNLERDIGTNEGVAGITQIYERDGRYDRVVIILETSNYRGYSRVQYGNTAMREIAAHEIGHALGLGHSTDKKNIMYPTYERREEINPLLLESTWPLLLVVMIVASIVIIHQGIAWVRYRKRRESLEDEIFKDENKER